MSSFLPNHTPSLHTPLLKFGNNFSSMAIRSQSSFIPTIWQRNISSKNASHHFSKTLFLSKNIPASLSSNFLVMLMSSFAKNSVAIDDAMRTILDSLLNEGAVRLGLILNGMLMSRRLGSFKSMVTPLSFELRTSVVYTFYRHIHSIPNSLFVRANSFHPSGCIFFGREITSQPAETTP